MARDIMQEPGSCQPSSKQSSTAACVSSAAEALQHTTTVLVFINHAEPCSVKFRKMMHPFAASSAPLSSDHRRAWTIISEKARTVVRVVVITQSCAKSVERSSTQTRAKLPQSTIVAKKWCFRCNCKRPETHHCIMSKSVKNEKKLTWKRFFYDFESMVDEETGEQVPVLFIAIKYCKQCSATIPTTLEEAQAMSCDACSENGGCKLIDCIQDDNRFINVAEGATEWTFSKENRGFVRIAHYASGTNAINSRLRQLAPALGQQKQLVPLESSSVEYGWFLYQLLI
ncbi:hypothetical protein CAEBREN_12305 [Caenorhabditis brenneri]|uniref:Uncharacterized protein n=1 Tax=Caenorhabditis brenneri TaxID=135651 RepID=G0NUB8_CAEBE|nr:hypothetical protein CAEBREN_12305 [Caenorhabditis brenneri]